MIVKKIFFILISSLLVFSSCTKKEATVSELVVLERMSLEKRITFLGRIRSASSSIVRAPFDGHLIRLHKDFGAVVAKGDTILEMIKSRPDDYLSTVVEDEGRLRQIQLSKNRVQLEVAATKRDLDRMQRLKKSGSVAGSELESVQVAYKVAMNSLQQLMAEEKTMERSLQLKRQANLKSAAKVLAPRAGSLTHFWVESESITPGMSIPKDTVITSVEDPSSYVVRAEVVESDYVHLKLGQPVSVGLVHGESDEGKNWMGSIKSISPLPEQDRFGIAKFNVIVSFPLVDQRIKPGLEARCSILLSKKENALALPRSAVHQSSNGEYFVSFPGKKAIGRRKVSIGTVGDTHVEIVAGLNNGQRVFKSYVEPHN